jgi:DNA invertase Pin-like site-specific DNA recombinase
MAKNGKASPGENGRGKVAAVGYLRTSSAANVGEDKDSHHRQRRDIEAFARARGFEVVEWFYDPAVSGDDNVTDRPGFTAMLDYLDGNSVRTVLVEDASRFARKMLAAELGILTMIERGTRVLTKSGDDLTETDDEMKIAMRQIAMAFAQLEKTRLVKKLKAARDRKSAELGKRIEGRKGYAETNPELVREAKRLARKSPKTGKARSLREIAAELAALEYVTASGKAFSAAQVQRLLGRE